MPGPGSHERTFAVGARFVLPSLKKTLPKGGRMRPLAPVTTRAVYYDTVDLRLTRAGVVLRQEGSKGTNPRSKAWMLRLPGTEVGRGGGNTIPADLVDAVTVYARGDALVPVVTLRVARTRYEFLDRDGDLLAEVDDNVVSVLDERRVRQRFREIGVWGRGKPVRRIAAALIDAGADSPVDRHRRALGEPAFAPPDLVPPGKVGRRASHAVAASIRIDVGAVIAGDPMVRLRVEAAGRTDTAVHQMRVAVRRLRSTLRTFAPLLVAEWAEPLAIELRWLGGVLGGVRETEMLQARLAHTATADPVAPLDGASVARIDADLTARLEEARAALDCALTSPRYRTLVKSLYAAAARPQFTPIAAGKAGALLPRFVGRAWRRMADGRHGIDGARDLHRTAPDGQWHAVRIRCKRVRYAAALVPKRPATDLAVALAAVADVLGAHQDAVVASRAWLDIAAADPDDHALAVTAGRLAERERSAARAARDSYPGVWRRARRDRLTAWLG